MLIKKVFILFINPYKLSKDMYIKLILQCLCIQLVSHTHTHKRNMYQTYVQCAVNIINTMDERIKYAKN